MFKCRATANRVLTNVGLDAELIVHFFSFFFGVKFSAKH